MFFSLLFFKYFCSSCDLKGQGDLLDYKGSIFPNNWYQSLWFGSKLGGGIVIFLKFLVWYVVVVLTDLSHQKRFFRNCCDPTGGPLNAVLCLLSVVLCK